MLTNKRILTVTGVLFLFGFLCGCNMLFPKESVVLLPVSFCSIDVQDVCLNQRVEIEFGLRNVFLNDRSDSCYEIPVKDEVYSKRYCFKIENLPDNCTIVSGVVDTSMKNTDVEFSDNTLCLFPKVTSSDKKNSCSNLVCNLELSFDSPGIYGMIISVYDFYKDETEGYACNAIEDFTDDRLVEKMSFVVKVMEEE